MGRGCPRGRGLGVAAVFPEAIEVVIAQQVGVIFLEHAAGGGVAGVEDGDLGAGQAGDVTGLLELASAIGGAGFLF